MGTNVSVERCGAETGPDPSNHLPFSQRSPGWFWRAPEWPVLRRTLKIGKAKAEQEGNAKFCLLKPTLPFLARLTLGVVIAKATAVVNIRIKQFWAIPLAGNLVAGPCMMTLHPCVRYRVLRPRSRTGGAAGRIASGGDRYSHDDVSRMAGDAGTLVAQRQECRDWAFPVEPAAKEFGCQQELGEGASEGEACEACEGNPGRRSRNARALQANTTGCI